MPAGLLQRKLLIVSGKGGVGKTTVTATLARVASRLKRRVLVIQSDPNVDAPANLHNLLDCQTFDTQERELHPHLWAMKSEPETAMRYALLSVIRSKFLYNRFFQSELVRGVVDAVPGLREAFIMYHVHAMALYGSRRRHFDLVIWDAPPTGHLPLYLKAPAILGRMFNRGYVHKVLQGLADFLRQPDQVALCLVTLPEETPVNETLHLTRRLHEEDMGFTGGIIINAFPGPLLGSEEDIAFRHLQIESPASDRLQDLLRDALPAPGDGAGHSTMAKALLLAARRQLLWESQAQALIQPLAELGVPFWTLPYFPSHRVGLAEIDRAGANWLQDADVHRLLTGKSVVEAVPT